MCGITGYAGSRPIFERILSRIRKVLACGGFVVAVVPEDEHWADSAADYTLRGPTVRPESGPIVSIVPRPLLAYVVARVRDGKIYQPRNLAKGITVE